MVKSYKYRILPTKKQAELINMHIGSCRFVYNLALETKQMAYAGNKVNLSCFDLMRQLPDLKKECIWLKKVNAQSLQQSITHLDTAYTRFFKGYSDFPKFKKKTSKGSFNIPQFINVNFEINKFVIPKFKDGIDIVLHRKFKGEIKQATIIRTSTGKYFASILVENKYAIPIKKKIQESTAIGIDLGIKSFIVSSNGQKFDNPKYLITAQSKLKFAQRKYSKHKGKMTKHRLTVLHEKIANQRRDFLHKTSTYLIKNHDNICIEDLNISGMLKNHCLAQSISDAGWGMFEVMLKYKAEWNGNNILQIGRFEPSSKMCSHCGSINKELKLSDREWVCSTCGVKHDRDENAAKNIESFALRNYLSVGRRRKNQNELPTLIGVLTSEASSHAVHRF